MTFFIYFNTLSIGRYTLVITKSSCLGDKFMATKKCQDTNPVGKIYDNWYGLNSK